MTPMEALSWAFRTAEDALKPFEAVFCEWNQTVEWYCHGCEGTFMSSWPQWTKPTDKTFPHEPGCKYIAAREALKGGEADGTRPAEGQGQAEGPVQELA